MTWCTPPGTASTCRRARGGDEPSRPGRVPPSFRNPRTERRRDVRARGAHSSPPFSRARTADEVGGDSAPPPERDHEGPGEAQHPMELGLGSWQCCVVFRFLRRAAGRPRLPQRLGRSRGVTKYPDCNGPHPNIRLLPSSYSSLRLSPPHAPLPPSPAWPPPRGVLPLLPRAATPSTHPQ